MINRFLPIGTVVQLKDATKKIMITSYLPKSEDKVYDYGACTYPEGILASNKTLAFNHDQIENVYYMGYATNEYTELNNKLNQIK